MTEDPSTRMEVEDTVIRMFVATDERDWSTLKMCFSDPFTLDMTSMVGGSPSTMTPQQVADAWSEGFKTLDHVHHQVGNFLTEVSSSTARVTCYGVALHHREGISSTSKTRRFVGTYDLDLIKQGDQWQITKLQFKLKFIDGNLELEKAT